MQGYPVVRGCNTKNPYYLQKGLIEAFNQLTMQVTIKEWNAVASWRWDMPDDDVCGICRVQFDGTCSTCKFPGDDCPLCMFVLWFHRNPNSEFLTIDPS